MYKKELGKLRLSSGSPMARKHALGLPLAGYRANDATSCTGPLSLDKMVSWLIW